MAPALRLALWDVGHGQRSVTRLTPEVWEKFWRLPRRGFGENPLGGGADATPSCPPHPPAENVLRNLGPFLGAKILSCIHGEKWPVGKQDQPSGLLNVWEVGGRRELLWSCSQQRVNLET